MNERSLSPAPFGKLCGRRLELFSASSLPEWGYEKPQTDSFAVLHPETYATGERYPLYVVFHSAGHDLYTALACTLARSSSVIAQTHSGNCTATLVSLL